MEQGMSFTDWLIVIGVLFVGLSPFMVLGMLVSSVVGGLLVFVRTAG